MFKKILFLMLALFALGATHASHAEVCRNIGPILCLYYAPDSNNPGNVDIKLEPPNELVGDKFHFQYDLKDGKLKNGAGYCVAYIEDNNHYKIEATQRCEHAPTTQWIFQDFHGEQGYLQAKNLPSQHAYCFNASSYMAAFLTECGGSATYRQKFLVTESFPLGAFAREELRSMMQIEPWEALKMAPWGVAR